MCERARTLAAMAVVGALGIACAARAQAPTGPEAFTAIATVHAEHGGWATAPVTIVVDRKMSVSEAQPLIDAFKSGGPAALRSALEGVEATGLVQLGEGDVTPTRLTIERATDKGRLLTIVTDEPLYFVGGGSPAAGPKEGYDFGVIDIEIDATGGGWGTLAPAARITVQRGAFVVQDYAADVVWLRPVTKSR